MVGAGFAAAMAGVSITNSRSPFDLWDASKVSFPQSMPTGNSAANRTSRSDWLQAHHSEFGPVSKPAKNQSGPEYRQRQNIPARSRQAIDSERTRQAKQSATPPAMQTAGPRQSQPTQDRQKAPTRKTSAKSRGSFPRLKSSQNRVGMPGGDRKAAERSDHGQPGSRSQSLICEDSKNSRSEQFRSDQDQMSSILGIPGFRLAHRHHRPVCTGFMPCQRHFASKSIFIVRLRGESATHRL